MYFTQDILWEAPAVWYIQPKCNKNVWCPATKAMSGTSGTQGTVPFTSASSFFTETNLSLSDYFNDDSEMSLANPNALESQERLPHLYILVGFRISNINHKL